MKRKPFDHQYGKHRNNTIDLKGARVIVKYPSVSKVRKALKRLVKKVRLGPKPGTVEVIHTFNGSGPTGSNSGIYEMFRIIRQLETEAQYQYSQKPIHHKDTNHERIPRRQYHR